MIIIQKDLKTHFTRFISYYIFICYCVARFEINRLIVKNTLFWKDNFYGKCKNLFILVEIQNVFFVRRNYVARQFRWFDNVYGVDKDAVKSADSDLKWEQKVI